MKIKYPFYTIFIVTIFSIACSVQAFQSNITISVNVAPSLNMTNHDGTILPSALTMNFIPSTNRLSSVVQPTMISSNDADQDVKIKLLDEPKLVSTQDPSKQVKLKVKLDDNNVTTTETLISKADLAFDKHIATRSHPVASKLTISQDPNSIISKPEIYQGTVNLVLTMAP